MRTTLTLDDDLYQKLAQESRASATPLRVVVNGSLRQALAGGKRPVRRRAFKVNARDMGRRDGCDVSRVSRLLEQLDGIKAASATSTP